MKWTLYILLLILSLYGGETAQAQSVYVSKAIRLNNKTPRFKVLGQNMDGIIVRNYGRNVEQLDFYDAGLNFRFSRTLFLRHNNFQPIGYLLKNHGAQFFFSELQKKFLYLYACSLNEKYESGPEICIDTVSMDNDDSRIFNSISSNHALTLIYYPLIKNGIIEKVKVISLSNQLQLLYKLDIPIEAELRAGSITEGLIDNRGNAYLVLQSGTEEGRHFTLFAYQADQKQLWKMHMQINKSVFGMPMFDIDEKNHLLLSGGLISNGEKNANEAATGIYYYRLDLDSLEDERFRSHAFTDSFMKELTGKASYNDNNLYTFKPKRVIARMDGGLIILAESFYREDEDYSVPSFNPGFSNYRTLNLFHYNDAITFSVSGEGELEWKTILRKNQNSENDNGAYSSFSILNTSNRLHYLFMNEIHPRSSLHDYMIDPDGSNHPKEIFNLEEKNVMLIPKLGVQIASREVVIPSYKNNEFRLVKLAY